MSYITSHKIHNLTIDLSPYMCQIKVKCKKAKPQILRIDNLEDFYVTNALYVINDEFRVRKIIIQNNFQTSNTKNATNNKSQNAFVK